MPSQLTEVWTGDMNSSKVEIELVLTKLPVNALWSAHWKILQLDARGDPQSPELLLYGVGEKASMFHVNRALLDRLGFTLQARANENA